MTDDSRRLGHRAVGISLSVVVPSYLRPHQLRRCLTAVAASSRPPDETIVVLRPDDVTSRAIAAGCEAKVVDVLDPGHLPPLAAGLRAVKGDVMVVYDDDAVPRPTCLERVEQRFLADWKLVALGGPIADPERGVPSPTEAARVLRRHGRLWYGAFAPLPNEASVTGPVAVSALSIESPIEVDHLPGGNLAMRVGPLRRVGFDLALNAGAAIGWEADVCLGLKRSGRVLFDPSLVVDHLRGPRTGAPQRDAAFRLAVDYSHNLSYIAAKHFRPRELAIFLPAMLLIGQQASPGLVRSLADLPGQPAAASHLAIAVARARLGGMRRGLARRRTAAFGADLGLSG